MDNKEAYKKGNTPSYYTGKSGIKAIDVIHDFDLTHCKASALEYILRSGKKDDEVEDLRKAINHLNMEIDKLEKESIARDTDMSIRMQLTDEGLEVYDAKK